MTLFSRKRYEADLLLLEYGVSSSANGCKFSERRETEERSFSRAERSQWEAHASHLF